MKRLAFLTVLLLLATPSLVRGQCDGITWQWDADQQLLAIDHHFEDNCAVFAIEYEVTLAENVIAVAETSICTAAAYCICPYEGHLKLADLSPGPYALQWHYANPYLGDECETELWITIPADAAGGVAHLQSVTTAGCGIVPTTVPDGQGDPGQRTWSGVKGLYQ